MWWSALCLPPDTPCTELSWWALGFTPRVACVDEAVEQINQFYSNFHSSRWLEGRFVIRLNHALSASALQLINQQFASLCKSGDFQQQARCEAERDEPELCDLTRLAFAFNGRDHGRLRELLDLLNDPQHWAENA